MPRWVEEGNREDLQKTFHTRLKAAVERTGVESGVELSRRSGVTQSAVSTMLRGGALPNAYTLDLLCQALETSPDDLLGYDDAPQGPVETPLQGRLVEVVKGCPLGDEELLVSVLEKIVEAGHTGILGLASICGVLPDYRQVGQVRPTHSARRQAQVGGPNADG